MKSRTYRATMALASMAIVVSMLAGCAPSGSRTPGDVADGSSTSEVPTSQTTGASVTTEQPSQGPGDESEDAAPATGGVGSSATGDDGDPPPASSEAQTLCNLTYEYVWALYVNGTNDEGEYLDIAALSLSDSLKIWRGLVGAYPDAEGDVERARAVYDAWQQASVASAAGDTDEYERLLAGSEADMKKLPSAGSATEVECT